MDSIRNKALAGSMLVTALVLSMANYASAQAADPIATAIDTTQSKTLGYAGAALAAVVAVVLVGVGIKIVPKVIRAVSARVTG